MSLYSASEIADRTRIPVEYVRCVIAYYKDRPKKPVGSAVSKGRYCPECDTAVYVGNDCSACKTRIDWS